MLSFRFAEILDEALRDIFYFYFKTIWPLDIELLLKFPILLYDRTIVRRGRRMRRTDHRQNLFWI